MTHNKPEPPDMRGDAVKLRQRIQDEIDNLRQEKEEALTPRYKKFCDGGIHSLHLVLEWIDETS